MTKSFNKTPLLLLVLLVLTISSCRYKETELAVPSEQAQNTFDIEAEKEKLKAICKLATERFIDRKSTADFYWKNPNTQIIQKTTFSDETFWKWGGKVKTAGGMLHVEANPNFVFKVIDRTDYVIEVTPQMAYVTYRQLIVWQDHPEAEELTGYSHETRVFVKEGNDWKIALATTMY